MNKVRIIISGYLVVEPRFELGLTSKSYRCTNPTGAHGGDPRLFITTGHSFRKTQDIPSERLRTFLQKDSGHSFTKTQDIPSERLRTFLHKDSGHSFRKTQDIPSQRLRTFLHKDSGHSFRKTQDIPSERLRTH
jgi:hypothetical protein